MRLLALTVMRYGDRGMGMSIRRILLLQICEGAEGHVKLCFQRPTRVELCWRGCACRFDMNLFSVV